MENLERSKDLFPSTTRFFSVLATSDTANSNLLTKAAFEELLRMDNAVRIFSFEYKGRAYSFSDLCVKSDANCKIFSSPLQFFETADGSFDLSSITDDQALVTRI